MIQVFIYETCSAGLDYVKSIFPENATTIVNNITDNNDILTHSLHEYSSLDYPEGMIIVKSEVICTASHSVIDIIKKIVLNREDPAAIYLHKYLDRCDQSRWLFKFDTGSIYGDNAMSYDVFESFNPHGFDVLYLTASAADMLLQDLPIPDKITAEHYINTRIREGILKAYTTTPQIFDYNTTKCVSYSDNFSKTTPCATPVHLCEKTYPPLLFQSTTTFWVFVVLFISILSVIFYRFMWRKFHH
jgi:hypothetical protein